LPFFPATLYPLLQKSNMRFFLLTRLPVNNKTDMSVSLRENRTVVKHIHPETSFDNRSEVASPVRSAGNAETKGGPIEKKSS